MDIHIPERKQHFDKVKKEELKIAQAFSEEIKKEMGQLLKAVVLFGSSARHTSKPKSDIDVLVLLDDLSVYITRDVADAYRMVIQKIINKVSRKLHVVTLRLTAFWDYIRNGDPIGINMLRDGIPLWDTGFIQPLQMLLQKGRIRPTEESMWAYYMKAPVTLKNAKWHIMQATVDLYWAVIDAAHAALMSQDAIPPTPEHVGDMLDKHLVKKGLLEKKYSTIMRNCYDRAKSILHSEVHEIRGSDFDKFLEEANAFVERMKVFLPDKKV